jgi:hypothetical protein
VEGIPARSKEGGGRGTEVKVETRGVEAKRKRGGVEEREEFFLF